MKKVYVAAVAVCGVFFCLPAHAQKTKAQLSTEVSTTFPDNTVGAITPAGVRTFQNDLINSIMPTAPVVSGNLVCFNGTTGLLQDCGSAPVTVPLTVGTTPINSGSTGRVLYDNAGLLGEYTQVQLTAQINLATAFNSGAIPAWPNTTTSFFRGDGSYQTLNCAALAGVAASCSTDATNASNISSGTLAGARYAAVNLAGGNVNGGVTGALPFSNLPTGSLDTVLGYWGATTASAISINNCANALTYSTSTHTFGCNVGAGTGTVTQINQGANTTANPGAGVNLSSNPCTSTCTATIDASYMKGYWSGCQMSAPGSNSTLTITACVTASDDNTTLMKTTSTYTKLMSSLWSVGSGGGCLDTGSTTINTWYHVFQIIRTDTGVVDFVCSTNATAPTSMPTNYTKQRRIGSFKTDGSSFITAFTQNFDLFLWSVPVQDLNQANPTSGARQTVTLASVPTGVVVEPNLQWGGDNTTANFNAIVTSLAMADTAPSTTLNSFRVAGTGTNPWAGSNIRIVTNTSAQVGYRVDATGASNRITAVTYGWRDFLGR